VKEGNNSTKIGYVVFSRWDVTGQMEKVFIAEYDEVDEAEILKATINNKNLAFSADVGIAYHVNKDQSDEFIDIRPKDDSESFAYTEMVSMNDIGCRLREVIETATAR